MEAYVDYVNANYMNVQCNYMNVQHAILKS
jgi:hypothetical protein